MDNEENIVQRLRGKDKGAFELIFNEYYSIMVAYAFRFMDTEEESEEIVQEVFVKFWEKCDQIAVDSNVKSYLYRSVHNSCLNSLKHDKVKDGYRKYVIDFLETTYEIEEKRSDPETLRNRIFSEIDNLPPRCSEIFKLSRVDGLKYYEIAEHLGISIKTVEVQIGKALKILREKLHDLKNGN